MKVSIQRTNATRVDITGYHSVTLVRSSRNRLGGGARARPAGAQ